MPIFRGLGSKLQQVRSLGSKALGGIQHLGSKVGGTLENVGEKVSVIAPSIGGTITQAGRIATAAGVVAGDIKSGKGLASMKNLQGVRNEVKSFAT